MPPRTDLRVVLPTVVCRAVSMNGVWLKKKLPNFLPKKKSLLPASFPTRLSLSPCPVFARRARTRLITPPSRKKSSAGTGAGFSGNCRGIVRRGQRNTVQPRPSRCRGLGERRRHSPYRQRRQLRASPFALVADPYFRSLQGTVHFADAARRQRFYFRYAHSHQRLLRNAG